MFGRGQFFKPDQKTKKKFFFNLQNKLYITFKLD